MDSGRLEIVNTGNSVFIGDRAGENDDLTNNSNVFIGHEAGRNNTTGVQNTFIGFNAGKNNGADRNVMIGRVAGEMQRDPIIFLLVMEREETKVEVINYISKISNSTTPLIWGDFDSDLVRIYGTLGIRNAYVFPTTDWYFFSSTFYQWCRYIKLDHTY